MQIRKARTSDARGIGEVNVAAWKVAYRGLIPDDYLSSLDAQARTRTWRAILEEDGWDTLVATDIDSDRVVGFVSAGPSRDPDADEATGEVGAIYVHPAQWRHGVGSALFETAVDGLRARFRRATLWVLASNAPAHAFYRSQGWFPDGTVKVEHRETFALTEHRYRCDLTVPPDMTRVDP